MPQLHETGYGRRLFEHELPELNRNLKRIADALEKLNEEKKPVAPVAPPEVPNNIKVLSSIKLTDIFSIRISNALLNCRNPKQTLYQLVVSTESDLMSVKNFGAKCLWEIKAFLHNKKLILDMSEDEINNWDHYYYSGINGNPTLIPDYIK